MMSTLFIFFLSQSAKKASFSKASTARPTADKKNFTTKLPRTTLGTGLAHTGINTGTPRELRLSDSREADKKNSRAARRRSRTRRCSRTPIHVFPAQHGISRRRGERVALTFHILLPHQPSVRHQATSDHTAHTDRQPTDKKNFPTHKKNPR